MHQTVLLKEAVTGLNIDPNGIYVDGTFGRGGHTCEILKQLGRNGRLIAVDKDLDAIEHCKGIINDPRLMLVHGSFADIKKIAIAANVLGKVDGVLLDLGVSSPQLDEAERGFSFMRDGPLDMRMNQTVAITAADFINKAAKEELVKIFRDFGEERYASRIANFIVEARNKQVITSTLQLAEIVKLAHPKWEAKKHPATKVFQAIRMHINNELGDLEKFLRNLDEVMAINGRLVIISFHSLEDRMVKRFIKEQHKGASLPKEIPIKAHEMEPVRWHKIGKKVIPSKAEIDLNPRARSAVMRIGEKIS